MINIFFSILFYIPPTYNINYILRIWLNKSCTWFKSPSKTNAYTVKGARGKVSFDSLTDKYASQLSNDASSEAYLSIRKMKSLFVIWEVRCDKYASGEA
jgi:hypothetical protein